MDIQDTQKESLHISEWLFMCSGVLLLVSGLVIQQSGDFTFWKFANIFYGVATVLFVAYSK